MPARASLRPCSELVVVAAKTFRTAAELIITGDTAAAQQLVARFDDAGLRAHWFDVLAEPDAIGPAPLTEPPSGPPAGPKTPSTAVKQSVFNRDGWRCRWCGTPVIAQQALKRMHLVFPVAFPRGSRVDEYHGLILAATASADHVVPRSHRGDHSSENLVTACWPCQFSRGNYTIEQLGLADPRRRPPVVDDWDGVAWFGL